ncbi:MAG: serine/threonine-protein kinase [Anaerolineae bacterium]|nr:serine/threonine protein kinase [Thermoflexales bacterium]MDW8406609.1 serine/threonine-protein kinase [Anaerolineae bacterium]
MVGKTLGRFRLLEEIGSGGFATVYLALDTQLNEPVAVKVLSEKAGRDPTAVARFEREAQALRKLPSHPNIVGLRASGRFEGRHYLVMDYLAGNDLSTVLSRQGKLPFSEAADIVGQIADALRAAAAVGLVHRDIKPENIRLLPDGTVKLLDFGIAREAGASRLTKEGLLAGTAAYVAPEVWRGQQPDQHSDIYALGCVFYEMLTGRPPFASDSLETMMRLHLESKPDLDALGPAGAPADVRRAIEHMLAKEPSKRPTYDGLLKQLKPYRPNERPAVGRSSSSSFTTSDDEAESSPTASGTTADETRVNLRAGSGRAASERATAGRPRQALPGGPRSFRLQPAGSAAGAGVGKRQAVGRGLSWRVGAALTVLLLLVGAACGALTAGSVGLPIILDWRAAQMAPTPAALARGVANMLRGTALPMPSTPTLSPTDTPVPLPTETPATMFSFIPRRLRLLPDGRRADYWIDDSSPGLTLDPPFDSEAGRLTWTRLDYLDPADYGSGFVTIRAGVTANIVWSMDRPLEPGFYELFIYRPYRPPDPLVRPFIAITVPYEVRLDGQVLTPFAGTAEVNHQAAYGQWVSIGGYELKRAGILSVRLDVENALPPRYEVAIDGLAIARLDGPQLTPTQTPSPTPTETPTVAPTAPGR